MNRKIIITLLALVTTVSFAQQNSFNKEVEIQRFVEQGGKVEETSPNIYKLTYPDGLSRVFNLNRKQNLNESLSGVDTTIINIWEIDTSLYAEKFNFWQKVEVANSWWAPLPVEDLNRNNRPELYGYTDFPDLPYPSGGPVRIFERDIDGIYKSIFVYDSSTIFVKALGDIHRTGGKEIYIHSKSVNNGVVYRSDSVGELPTVFDFIFYYNANQVNDMTFGDFDNNNISDCAFIDGAGAQHCIIGEYRDSINNFEQLFQYSTTNEGDLSGFAINDFDQDGKTELVVGSGSHGNVYVIENIDNNEYSFINQFSFPFPNAYMKTTTKDIDGNGKSEYWIGGQDFEEGVSTFQCYESDEDNSYKVVAIIELRYLVSFYANYIQSSDIDNDGTEELIISVGNSILILKFIGSINEHKYDLYYAKLGEATQPGAEFYPVAIADLDGDDKKDILLPFRKYQYPVTYAFSYILKQVGTSGINFFQAYNNNSIDYISCYPNPFNASSTIRFTISKEDFVEIKVYNFLGKEITTLLDERLSQGEYQIRWEAEDKYGNALPSGIYLISLQSKHFVKSIKTILLK